MNKNKGGEQRFYEPLRKWLESNLECYTGGDVNYNPAGKLRYYTKTGIRALQADVIGLRFSGSNIHSDLSIYVIEVKDEIKITRQYINQAYGYSTFADFTYLASPANLDEDSKNIMQNLGVGYIQIKSSTNIHLIVSAAPQTPLKKEKLALLQALWIGKCSLCHCYFPIWTSWSDDDDNELGKSYFSFERPKFPKGPKDAEYEIDQLDKKNKIKCYLCYYCKKEFLKK